MKGKLLLLTVLIVAFALFVLVRFFILDKTSEYGNLEVVSSPTTSVFINNSLVGKTPISDYKMKVNEYLIKLIPEGISTETASWNGKISIYKNALTYVNRELGSSDLNTAGEIFTTKKMESPPENPNNGGIYVETDPQGAIVTLDNDEKGVAPLDLDNVSQGDHELSVFMPGFFRRTQKINVDPGYRVNALFKLAIDQSQKQVTTTEEQASASASAQTGQTYVSINDNPQGWLRVRDDASVDASEEAKVKPGEKYQFLDEKSGWYEIKYNGDQNGLVSGEFTDGWVSAEYATKQ